MRQQNSGAVEDFYFIYDPKVKALLKSVHSYIYQSYRKNRSGTFLMAHGVVTVTYRIEHKTAH